jgi:Lrp/AsnC family leucine-responsive transcriptional regulator
MIDEIDRKIIEILQEDARTPNSEIAKEIGIVPSATAERIKKLVQRGLITGYSVRLDPQALGLGQVAFIFVKADEEVRACRTAKELAAIPEILEVHNIAGEDCYLVKVRVKNTEALGRFLREKLGKVSSVTSTRTVVVLESFKETLKFPVPPTAGDVIDD